MMFDRCLSKEVLGHVSLNWNKLAAKFLQFPDHCIRSVVTGKRVNRGVGFDQKIPSDYIFTDTLE